MLRFEREVVTALGSAPDPTTRGAVEAFVDRTLTTMPEFVRLGVLAETILLGTYIKLLTFTGRVDSATPADLRVRLDSWESSRIQYLRQYVHMFRSLVVFAECELAPEPEGALA